MFKTLAHKHKTSVTKIANRLKTNNGYALIVREEHKTRITRLFRFKDWHPPHPGHPNLDRLAKVFVLTLCHSELIRRLNGGQCEYCETKQGPFEVHHIRRMKDVAHKKELWQRMMAARYRKTFVLCRRCHHLLHDSIIVIIYHILSTKQSYQDLGEDYFNRLEAPRLERHHVRQLEQLGYTVTLSPRVA